MRNCILCRVKTEGSIGAAGIKWPNICQPCKDIEDNALLNKLRGIPEPLDRENFDEVDALKVVEHNERPCLIDMRDYPEQEEHESSFSYERGGNSETDN